MRAPDVSVRRRANPKVAASRQTRRAESLIRLRLHAFDKGRPAALETIGLGRKLPACLMRADQRRSTLLRMSSGKVEAIVVSGAAAGARSTSAGQGLV